MDPLDLRRSLVIAALLGFLFLMGTVPFHQSIKGPCQTAPAAVWYLNSNGAGQIVSGWERNLLNSGNTRVLVQFERPDFVEVTIAPHLHDGALVEAGDTIAVITSHEGLGRFEVLEAELSKSRSEHQALLTGAKAEDIEVARAEVKRARIALKSYGLEYERAEALYDSGHISASEWQIVEGQYNVLAAELDLAEANLKALEAGARPEDIEVARGQTEVLRRSLETEGQLLSKPEVVTAPVSGRVRLGDVPETLIRIERMDTLAVLVSIPEASASLLRVGQPMEVKLLADHIPNRESNLLRIDFIPPAAPQLSGAYAVGLLDNSKGKLQPGMSGIAILSIGKKTLFSGLRARFNI